MTKPMRMVALFERRRAAMHALVVLSFAVFSVIAPPAPAQTTVNSSTSQLPSSAGGGSGSATSMWGAGGGSGSSGGSSSLVDSATAHDTLGQSAALVQSAKRGFLYSQGTSIILESIGAQSIVNTSIYGDNNVADISANQTSSNTGNVNATGSISLSGNATTTTAAPANTTAAPANTTTAPKPNTTTNPTAIPLSGGVGMSGAGEAAGAAAGGAAAGHTANSSTTVGNGQTSPSGP